MLHRLSSLRARNSCCVYDLTAFTCSPMSLPYFLSTWRRFILQHIARVTVIVLGIDARKKGRPCVKIKDGLMIFSFGQNTHSLKYVSIISRIKMGG